MKKTAALTLILVLACLFAISGGMSRAEAIPGSEILAEKTELSRLSPDDRFLIVSEAGKATVSLKPSGGRLAAADVTLAHTETRRVLTEIPADAAVFLLEESGDGDLYLKCAGGYLTCPKNESGLYLAENPETCSAWRLTDGEYLLNPHAADEENGSGIFLEYFPGGPFFSAYSRAEAPDPSMFRLSLYRLGNSLPDETVTEDTHYRLPVFFTSDVHGYLADVPDSGDTVEYTLAFIADKVRDIRGSGDNARKDLALLLDGGDIYQGSPLSGTTNGTVMSAAYDMMGYDAVALGNHEFDWGLENTVDADGTMMDYRLRELEGVNRIPVLVCDLFRNGEKVPLGGDYVILEKTARDSAGHELPVRIGVIGMAGNYDSSIRHSLFTGQGYTIEPDYGAVNALAEKLKTTGGCDAAVLIAHEDPLITAEGLGEGTAVDLLLGGHTHTWLNWETAGGLTVLEPSCHGAAWAYADLAFTAADGKPVLEGVENPRVCQTGADRKKLLNTPENREELDGNIVWLADRAIEISSAVLDAEIGYITVPLRRTEFLPGSGDRANTCGNWIASLLARAASADVAFVNNGGLRIDLELNPATGRRSVTASILYSMFPFENELWYFDLTWKELLTVLEYAMTPDGSELLTRVWGVDCYFTDDGVNALVTADGEAVYVNGVWKDGWADKMLRVSVSDYVATSDRNNDGQMPNPFIAWSSTSRLVRLGITDLEGIIRVLTKEAAANDGHLFVDTAPHFINKVYQPAEGN